MCGNLSFLQPCSDGSGALPQQHKDRGPLSGAVGLALPTDLLWRPSSDGEVSIEVWPPVMAARGRVHWLAACFGHPAVILNSKWGGSLLEFRRGTLGSTPGGCRPGWGSRNYCLSPCTFCRCSSRPLWQEA